MKQYLVFMCPRCRHYTNAPVGQKRRVCSYCGKIIDISKAATALFDDSHAAAEAVKQFNAGKDHDFEEVVRESREKILRLLPPSRLKVGDVADDVKGETLPTGKTRRLMMLLERLALDQPCTIGELEDACKKYGLQWSWAEAQLEKLFAAGEVFYPTPWKIRYIGAHADKKKPSTIVDITNELLAYLRKHDEEVSVKDLYAHYAQHGVSEESVDAALERLMRQNEIYQPKPNYVRAL
ncbi:MAG: hypothetical protein K9W43_09750 [Candidatus Thorarchaeota archaeon]|nr:hypothetical protein [Candidatus Thorarchaeota archaeon]